MNVPEQLSIIGREDTCFTSQQCNPYFSDQFMETFEDTSIYYGVTEAKDSAKYVYKPERCINFL